MLVAGTAEEIRAYDLPPGEAATMLGRLSTAAGCEVLFAAESVRGVRTQGVRGRLSAREAAARMLDGTELLALRDERTGALAIRRRDDGGEPAAAPERAGAGWPGEFAVVPARVGRRHRGPVMRAVEPLLVQQAGFLASTLQPWPRAPGAARLPLERGPPSGEHGIRPSAHTAKGLALLAAYLPDEALPADWPRPALRARAGAVLRFLLATHGPEGGGCDDGRPWQGQWQSAHWAALAGEAAWLLWDGLDAAEQARAARMIAHEAERFAGATPPSGRVRDSKAEENAWNSQILSLAGLMFPQHPRAAVWREAAVRWMASSFARPADLARTEPVDGRPRREWIAGANLHDDFTLENHSRVHPDYLACTYLLTSQAPLYAWGGRPAPAAMHLNVPEINATLKRLALPDGAWVYPNGQDWGLRRNVDWFEYHTALAVLHGDAQSAALQRACLATMTRMAARQPQGAIYVAGETRLSSDQAMALELPAHAYALMAELGEGPAPEDAVRLMGALAGRHVFAEGKFAVVRTPRTIATFSWGAQVMGQVMPLGENQLLAPEMRGLVGHVAVPGVAREAPVVREVAVAPREDGFGIAGVLARGGGALEQRFAFVALPDGRVVYADQVRWTGGPRPTLLDLGTLGVLNDRHWPAHPGRRTVRFEGGERTFVAAEAERDAPGAWRARWLHLDGLGVVRLAATGEVRYVPQPSGAAGRLEQRLHLNAVPAAELGRETAAPGDVIAHGVFVFYPDRTAAATRAAAAACRVQGGAGAPGVQVVLEDGMVVAVDLARLALAWPEAPAGRR